MKKITILTRQLRKVGGIERFVVTLAKILSENFEVEVVANYGKPSEETAFPFPKNVKITYLSPVEPEAISLKKIVSEKRFGKILSEITRRKKIKTEQKAVFEKFLGTLKTDIIITERSDYNFLVKSFYKGDAKKIATDHNFHQNDYHYIRKLLRSVKGFDALVVATKELKDFYSTRTSTKVLYIPNALEKIPVKKSKLKTKNLVAVGRFVPEKDFCMLVDVMKYVYENDREARLTIIGDGPEFPQIKAKVKKLGLENVVSLPGFLSQEAIAEHYLDSSLYVMTSRTEAFGLALTEAMSYGLPCIALDRASGAREQITEKTGVLIHSERADRMAKEIVRLLNDRERLLEYQSEIDRRITRCAPERVRTKWQHILD